MKRPNFLNVNMTITIAFVNSYTEYLKPHFFLFKADGSEKGSNLSEKVFR